MQKLAAIFLLFSVASAAIAQEAPKTGYFKTSYTPFELLGEQGAQAVASVFPADESLTWQLYVPPTYDPEKPAGVMLFIGWSHWGGGRKVWNDVLAERNIIWIGLIDGGDKKPVNERVLRALLAQAVLEREYRIDHSRYYLFGYSGGAHVAAMLATSKPETFKGVWFYAGALGWGNNAPPKLELMKQNRYIFMAGSLDDDRRKIAKVAESYREAGIVNAMFKIAPNLDRKMPPPTYLETVFDHLDSQN